MLIQAWLLSLQLLFCFKNFEDARHVVELREVKILQQMVPPAKENKSNFLPHPPFPITDMNKHTANCF